MKAKLIKESVNQEILDLVPIQDDSDDSMFRLILPNGYEVVAMGDEFNPEDFDMSLEEMLKFIDDGIEKFLKSKIKFFNQKKLGDYADFFTSEFNDSEMIINGRIEDVEFLSKNYVIGKLICGKENAKNRSV